MYVECVNVVYLIYQMKTTMKTINEVKPSKYNYTVVLVKKDGSFVQYGNGSVKLENAQKNANYWNNNYNFSSYPNDDFFDVAMINK